MATVLPSTPDVLILKVQAQVMIAMTLPYECVPIIMDGEDEETRCPVAQAETLVMLSWGDSSFDMKQEFHAGRFCMVDRPNFTAALWTRLLLDEKTRSDIRLADPAIGHLRQRNSLINALAIFAPLDANQNWLVSEPIKPTRTTRPKKSKTKKGWTRSTVEFVAPYMMVLDQGRQ